MALLLKSRLLLKARLLLTVFLVIEPSHGLQDSKDFILATKPSLQSKPQPFTPASSENNSCSATLPKQNNCSNSADCPTWFVCNHTQSGKCQCGPGYQDAIKCDVKRMVSAVMNCYCVTYGEASGKTCMLHGMCFYNCEQLLYNKIY